MIIITYIIIGNSISKRIIIPSESIRVRVIANSNSDYDQVIKKEVKDILNKDLVNILKDASNITIFRNDLVNNLGMIEDNIEQFLTIYNLPVDVNYGLNYFPKKIFNGIEYNAGYYESLVVTLGNGLGDNWWCVLFPPLCLLEAEESDNVQYTTLVSELINKYF